MRFCQTLNLAVFVAVSLISPILVVANETPVQIIPLAAPLSSPEAEISGLAWCNDKLILMPQYPGRISTDGQSYFYSIEKNDIRSFLNGTDRAPLAAEPILINESDLRSRISQSDADGSLVYEGFEAIACDKETLWLTIEAYNQAQRYQSFLIPAQLNTDHQQARIDINSNALRALPSQSNQINMGEESLIIDNNYIIALHESNDPRLTQQAQAHRLNSLTNTLDQIGFPHIPFRITDATALDGEGRFWAINYKYSGDKFSRTATDPLAEQYGSGNSHQTYYNVERLIEFELVDHKISRVDQPPIQLQMNNVEGRNWEGIARLDDVGLLIATDKHPHSLFGFVPFPATQPFSKHTQ